MKIQYASDLHLEFSANSSHLKLNPLEVVGDILLLAGDIGYLSDDGSYPHPFWDWASKNYKQVIVVPGNHELYNGFDINKLHKGLIIPIRENVAYHYNSVVSIENVDIIVSTLWAYIEPIDALATQRRVSDFRSTIADGDERLTVDRFNAEHQRCIEFIKNAVANSKAEKIVVVTHHVPSSVLSSPDFKGSQINGAFVSEQFDFIENSPIDYWIYGHSHRNIDGVIGNTQCLSNQLGYVAMEDIDSFDRAKYIEL
ncbi:MAG: metallophosphoesterase [Rikenellaceae bacterium]